MTKPRFNNDALKQHGYDDPTTPLVKLVLDATGTLKESQPFSFRPRPAQGIARGASEVIINNSRVHCSNLYVPGLTQFTSSFTFSAPMGMMPRLHVYTTQALKTQAIADIKQGMRAILTRHRDEAQALVDRHTSALDRL